MKQLIAAFAAIMLVSPLAQAGDQPIIKDQAELERLIGAHPFALQWISWQKFGRVEIKREKQDITLTGAQEDKKTGNYIKIDGVITEIADRIFKFTGSITYRVDHLNSGKPCTREGNMTFRRRGNRKYWRLTNMSNPCDAVTDYIDVYTILLDKKKK